MTTRLEERRAKRAAVARRRLAVAALAGVFTGTLAVAIGFGVSIAPDCAVPGCEAGHRPSVPADRQDEPSRSGSGPGIPPIGFPHVPPPPTAIPDIVPDDAVLPCEPYCDPGK